MEEKFVRTSLRIPQSLHALLLAEAHAAGRSLNAEIIARLRAIPEQRCQSASITYTIKRADMKRFLEIEMDDLTRKLISEFRRHGE